MSAEVIEENLKNAIIPAGTSINPYCSLVGLQKLTMSAINIVEVYSYRTDRYCCFTIFGKSTT